ncbi:hypothetical protein D6833_03585, partial [Candidatus Parcubacteria bacterium]
MKVVTNGGMIRWRIMLEGKVLLFCFMAFFLVRGSALAQVHWTTVGDAPVLSPGPEGSWDAGIVFLPAVIQDGDTLKMWYTGSAGNYLTSDPMSIGYAWSLDGVNWTKYAGNPVLAPRPGEFDAGGLAAPVVFMDGDTLRM